MLWLDVNKHSEKAEPDMSTKMRLRLAQRWENWHINCFPMWWMLPLLTLTAIQTPRR